VKAIKVIISGGGTGGHIYPAIAIANALKEINPAVEVLFVGAEGKWRWKKYPRLGILLLVYQLQASTARICWQT
jgi:UDP-N-acetylglucosamine--N-acetylmuramyl-(pentapeptide) pyrophosphoryl-undecaprenol N-acetylglucosamine transferase